MPHGAPAGQPRCCFFIPGSTWPREGEILGANSTNASAIEIVDLPIENSGFTHWKWWIYPLKIVIYPLKMVDLPIENGDLPIENGDFP